MANPQLVQQLAQALQARRQMYAQIQPFVLQAMRAHWQTLLAQAQNPYFRAVDLPRVDSGELRARVRTILQGRQQPQQPQQPPQDRMLAPAQMPAGSPSRGELNAQLQRILAGERGAPRGRSARPNGRGAAAQGTARRTPLTAFGDLRTHDFRMDRPEDRAMLGRGLRNLPQQSSGLAGGIWNVFGRS